MQRYKCYRNIKKNIVSRNHIVTNQHTKSLEIINNVPNILDESIMQIDLKYAECWCITPN